ncbi:hypothetical protein SAMN05660776_2886 [Salegentibacter holothuriorum]|uniref:Uncharacterized protein n=1 Tax=Salegentibacter holothuriorum TaxID=241145 RepID=A0A1T5DYU3_9FLAO|nr:hypothetical protein [Salegentibacter holothuriorum]SKB76877.1 hypothetical protein SAMN05660776_2886 [Salegentibacter holothuriorum]
MNLEITHIQGGMLELERTGIYPEYLLFNLPGTKQRWRVKIKKKPQNGILKSKGVVVYEYKFDDHFCKIRRVKSDGSFSTWKEPEFMSIEMRD